MFWLISNEEISPTDALDYQAVPDVKYITLSQYGATGSKRKVKFLANLNRYRTKETAQITAIYNTVSDPTSNDMLFLNIWIQSLDKSSFTSKVVI